MSSNNDDSRPATPARPSTPKVALQRAGSVVQNAAQKAGKTMRSLSIIRKLSQRSKRRPDPPVSPDSMLIHETEAWFKEHEMDTIGRGYAILSPSLRGEINGLKEDVTTGYPWEIYREQIRAAIGDHKINKIVCLGAGSLYRCRQTRGSGVAQIDHWLREVCFVLGLHQLLTKEWFPGQHVDIIFQEPLLTDKDQIMLSYLSCSILHHPEAKECINENTLVFANKLEWSSAFELVMQNNPAVYIGQDIEGLMKDDDGAYTLAEIAQCLKAQGIGPIDVKETIENFVAKRVSKPIGAGDGKLPLMVKDTFDKDVRIYWRLPPPAEQEVAEGFVEAES